MPFKSLKQSKACFATHGFGNKIDCKEWAAATNYKNMKKMGGRLRPKPCMECRGTFQTGGIIQAAPNPALTGCPDGYAPDALGKCVAITGAAPQNPYIPASTIPAMDPNQTGIQGSNTNEGALNRGEVPNTPEQDQYAMDPNKKKKSNPVDPYFAFRGFTNGLAWLSGIMDRRRQNQYMQAQFDQLGQQDAMPVENFQPNPFSLYAKYGGSLKKYQVGGTTDQNLKLLALLRGSQADTPTARKMTKGGRFMGINPAHKSWCTPLSNPHCTGARRRLALTLKKHHGFHE